MCIRDRIGTKSKNKSNKTSSQNPAKTDIRNPPTGSQERLRNPLTEEERKRIKQDRKQKGLCLYCGNANHIVANCPEKKKRDERKLAGNTNSVGETKPNTKPPEKKQTASVSFVGDGWNNYDFAATVGTEPPRQPDDFMTDWGSNTYNATVEGKTSKNAKNQIGQRPRRSGKFQPSTMN